MNKFRTSEIVCWLAVGIAFAVSFFYYDALPDPVPTHFNANGKADGWTPKPWGALVMPLATAFSYLLLSVLPRISPKNFGMDEFKNAYQIVKTAVVVFMAFASITATAYALGNQFISVNAIVAAIGVLFVIIGNVLGKTRKNFFFGIRTPWTLANDEVWFRTHRLGGHLMVVGGVLVIIFGAMGAKPAVILTILLSSALIPVGYSYWLYRKLEGFDPNSK